MLKHWNYINAKMDKYEQLITSAFYILLHTIMKYVRCVVCEILFCEYFTLFNDGSETRSNIMYWKILNIIVVTGWFYFS